MLVLEGVVPVLYSLSALTCFVGVFLTITADNTVSGYLYLLRRVLRKVAPVGGFTIGVISKNKSRKMLY